jgi:uncharacterized membrane protein
VSGGQWALLFHLLGAFTYVSGTLISEVVCLRARRIGEPRAIAALLGVSRVGEHVANAGAALVLGFGIWLVGLTPYSLGDAWIIAALILFALQGGPAFWLSKRRRKQKALAEQLAESGSAGSSELQASLRSPWATAMAALSVLMVVSILVLMVWKPAG